MNKSGSEHDKREYAREEEYVDVELKPITYPLEKGSGDKGRLKNVAEGGVCFTVSRPYEPGVLLEVKIHLTGWQRFKKSYTRVIDDDVAVAPLTAVGEVVWCNPDPDGQSHEVGVKFKDIYEDDFQAMQKYLEQLR